MELLLVMLLLFVFFSLVCFWMFFFSLTLCMAQEGYLHVVNASSICVNSSFFCSWLEQMLLALCNKEFITLYLLAMEWWLSHCKYWLVWVGFLYMEVDKLPSSFTVTRVSRKGRDPSALVFSAVNWIFSSILFKCWKNSSLCAVFWMTKVSSTYLFQRLGGCGAVSRALVSKCSIYMFATMRLSGDPMAAPSTCSKCCPWKTKLVLLKQNSNSWMMCLVFMLVLLGRSLSSFSFSSMIFSTGGIGTDVKSAVTS